MNKNIIWWIVGLVILALGVVYLFDNSTSKKNIKVAMPEPFVHVAMDDFRKGVRNAFSDNGYQEGKNLTLDIKNGQGDTSATQAIVREFAKGEYDLYLTVGTPASQATLNLVKDKPIVFGAVTDPVFAKIVSTMEHPGGNVTGVSDGTNYRVQFSLFKKVVPQLKKVGLIYNPGEPNSVSSLKNVQALGPELGIEFVVVPVSNTNEVMNAARSIADKIDGYFMLADTTVIAAADSVIKVSLEKKKPFFAFEESEVKNGGLICIGASYERIGYKTGQLAVRVLNGENPGDLKVEGLESDDVDIFVNQTTADKLGIKIPDDVLKSAKQIYK